MIIFLIGFMGSGKSYWGKRWSDANSLSFIDLDESIVSKVGKSIPQIFEENGECYFRKTEAEILRASLNENTIIACGGGTACFHNNMDWMNAHGVTVYLYAAPALIMHRLTAEDAGRPLLKDAGPNLFQLIESTLSSRLPDYEKAQFILDAGSLHLQSLNEILT